MQPLGLQFEASWLKTTMWFSLPAGRKRKKNFAGVNHATFEKASTFQQADSGEHNLSPNVFLRSICNLKNAICQGSTRSGWLPPKVTTFRQLEAAVITCLHAAEWVGQEGNEEATLRRIRTCQSAQGGKKKSNEGKERCEKQSAVGYLWDGQKKMWRQRRSAELRRSEQCAESLGDHLKGRNVLLLCVSVCVSECMESVQLWVIPPPGRLIVCWCSAPSPSCLWKSTRLMSDWLCALHPQRRRNLWPSAV